MKGEKRKKRVEIKKSETEEKKDENHRHPQLAEKKGGNKNK